MNEEEIKEIVNKFTKSLEKMNTELPKIMFELGREMDMVKFLECEFPGLTGEQMKEEIESITNRVLDYYVNKMVEKVIIPLMVNLLKDGADSAIEFYEKIKIMNDEEISQISKEMIFGQITVALKLGLNQIIEERIKMDSFTETGFIVDKEE